MTRRIKPKLAVIAQYADEDKVLKLQDDYEVMFQFFVDLISLRVDGLLSFRSLRLVNLATKRVLFEYKDYRYIAKQNYEFLTKSIEL